MTALQITKASETSEIFRFDEFFFKEVNKESNYFELLHNFYAHQGETRENFHNTRKIATGGNFQCFKCMYFYDEKKNQYRIIITSSDDALTCALENCAKKMMLGEI